MVDVPTLTKWLEDLTEIERYHLQSFVANHASPEQTTAHNAVKTTISELRADLKLKLNG